MLLYIIAIFQISGHLQAPLQSYALFCTPLLNMKSTISIHKGPLGMVHVNEHHLKIDNSRSLEVHIEEEEMTYGAGQF